MGVGGLWRGASRGAPCAVSCGTRCRRRACRATRTSTPALPVPPPCPPPAPLYRTCTAAVSDIPDWCFVEAWGSEEGRRRAGAGPSSDDIQRFRDVSPVAHVGQVGGGLNCRAGAPSCVCVGGEQVCGDLDRP